MAFIQSKLDAGGCVGAGVGVAGWRWSLEGEGIQIIRHKIVSDLILWTAGRCHILIKKQRLSIVKTEIADDRTKFWHLTALCLHPHNNKHGPTRMRTTSRANFRQGLTFDSWKLRKVKYFTKNLRFCGVERKCNGKMFCVYNWFKVCPKSASLWGKFIAQIDGMWTFFYVKIMTLQHSSCSGHSDDSPVELSFSCQTLTILAYSVLSYNCIYAQP